MPHCKLIISSLNSPGMGCMYRDVYMGCMYGMYVWDVCRMYVWDVCKGCMYGMYIWDVCVGCMYVMYV